jgi:hypothetical protein
MRRLEVTGNLWGDHAFPYDLNKDRKPEYLAPLQCSPVGNCEWGVFALNPTRYLGTIWAQTIFFQRRRAGWDRIISYGHISVSDGEMSQYCFRKGRYSPCGKAYEVNFYQKTYPRFYSATPWINCPKE